MASGVGAFGGTGHCYRFWLGFANCRASTADPTLCALERADYLECLSRDKLKTRISAKSFALKQVREEEAGGGKKDGGHAAAH